MAFSAAPVPLSGGCARGSSEEESGLHDDGVSPPGLCSDGTRSSVFNVTDFLHRGHPQSWRPKALPKRPSCLLVHRLLTVGTGKQVGLVNDSPIDLIRHVLMSFQLQVGEGGPFAARTASSSVSNRIERNIAGSFTSSIMAPGCTRQRRSCHHV